MEVDDALQIVADFRVSAAMAEVDLGLTASVAEDDFISRRNAGNFGTFFC